MTPILKLYTSIIFGFNKLSYKEVNKLLFELELLSLSQYTKNLTKDKRTIYQLKQLVQEELHLKPVY